RRQPLSVLGTGSTRARDARARRLETAGRMIALVAPTALSAIACLVLVLAEYRRWSRVRAIAKVLASLAFIVVGTLALGAHEAPNDTWRQFQMFVLVGLVLGAVGDAALLGASNRAFLVGLGAFLLGHVAFVVAFGQLAAPADWLVLGGGLAVAPAVVGIAVLAWLWPRLGAMRVPVIAYVVVIVAMVVGALAALSADGLPARSVRLLAVGAVLFFASDLAVA